MKRTLTILAILALFMASNINAQGDPNYTLRVGSESAQVGSSVDISAILDFVNGAAISGISYGVCNWGPPERLRWRPVRESPRWSEFSL